MVFFAASWVITLIGWVIHVFADHSPMKRTGHRVLELFFLWFLVVTGVFSIIGGIGHTSAGWPMSSPFKSATRRRCSSGRLAGAISPRRSARHGGEELP